MPRRNNAIPNAYTLLRYYYYNYIIVIINALRWDVKSYD